MLEDYKIVMACDSEESDVKSFAVPSLGMIAHFDESRFRRVAGQTAMSLPPVLWGHGQTHLLSDLEVRLFTDISTQTITDALAEMVEKLEADGEARFTAATRVQLGCSESQVGGMLWLFDVGVDVHQFYGGIRACVDYKRIHLGYELLEQPTGSYAAERQKAFFSPTTQALIQRVRESASWCTHFEWVTPWG